MLLKPHCVAELHWQRIGQRGTCIEDELYSAATTTALEELLDGGLLN